VAEAEVRGCLVGDESVCDAVAVAVGMEMEMETNAVGVWHCWCWQMCG